VHEDGMFNKIERNLNREKTNLDFNGVGFLAIALGNHFCTLHMFTQEINRLNVLVGHVISTNESNSFNALLLTDKILHKICKVQESFTSWAE
jgi:hypothetical protein